MPKRRSDIHAEEAQRHPCRRARTVRTSRRVVDERWRWMDDRRRPRKHLRGGDSKAQGTFIRAAACAAVPLQRPLRCRLRSAAPAADEAQPCHSGLSPTQAADVPADRPQRLVSAKRSSGGEPYGRADLWTLRSLRRVVCCVMRAACCCMLRIACCRMMRAACCYRMRAACCRVSYGRPSLPR
jgi:hypothetical protein